MSQKDKLIARLKSKPKDFTLDEAETLLGYFGFRRSNRGRTSGSSIGYISDKYGTLNIHRPHPGSVLKAYQVTLIVEKLNAEGLL